MARFGRLDILVNNAGIARISNVEDTSESEWDLVMGINAKGVFLSTKAAIPAMRRTGGGSIVNISSIAGLVGGTVCLQLSKASSSILRFTMSLGSRLLDRDSESIRILHEEMKQANVELEKDIRSSSILEGLRRGARVFTVGSLAATTTSPLTGEWIAGPAAAAASALYELITNRLTALHKKNGVDGLHQHYLSFLTKVGGFAKLRWRTIPQNEVGTPKSCTAFLT